MPLAEDTAGKASGIGLVIILALAGASVFLFRSMSKKLRRLPPTFDAEEPPRLPEPPDPADDAVAAAHRPPPDRPGGQPPGDPGPHRDA